MVATLFVSSKERIPSYNYFMIEGDQFLIGNQSTTSIFKDINSMESGEYIVEVEGDILYNQKGYFPNPMAEFNIVNIVRMKIIS